MRKTIKFFTIIAIVATGLFTGCVEDVVDENPPTISVTPSADTTDVYIGDSIDFTLSLGSGNGLASLKTLNSPAGVEIVNGDVTFAGESSQAATVTVKVTSAATDSTVYTITFIVKDAAKENHAIKYIRAIKKATALTAAKDFTWIREGSVPATGLDAFGLSFTKTIGTVEDGFYARIDIATDGATKFVELESTAWTTITTVEALKTAIDAASAIVDGRWSKISASKSDTYNYVLGVVYKDVYYMLHITNGKVESITAGTKITINGQSKN